jgi:1,4-alpha-glucan branching enzyme
VPLDQKQPYDPEAARRKAELHAGNFLFNRTKQIEYLRQAFGEGPPPIVISPYDAELYGHWWYEGPMFLDLLIRKAAHDQDVLQMLSPIDYLAMYPEQQVSQPPMSSWGAGGYAGVWLDESNDWIYRYLHKAADRMIELARSFQDASGVQRRALNQAARELLLAQSSDWAFIIKTGTMVDYAVRRTREHLLRFTRLYEQIKGNQVDEPWLGQVESRDNLFPEIDYRVYRPQPA